jgi:hypothetical protein
VVKVILPVSRGQALRVSSELACQHIERPDAHANS